MNRKSFLKAFGLSSLAAIAVLPSINKGQEAAKLEAMPEITPQPDFDGKRPNFLIVKNNHFSVESTELLWDNELRFNVQAGRNYVLRAQLLFHHAAPMEFGFRFFDGDGVRFIYNNTRAFGRYELIPQFKRSLDGVESLCHTGNMELRIGGDYIVEMQSSFQPLENTQVFFSARNLDSDFPSNLFHWGSFVEVRAM